MFNNSQITWVGVGGWLVAEEICKNSGNRRLGEKERREEKREEQEGRRTIQTISML